MSDTLSVRFTLRACAEPGLLPRLLQPFAKRDLTPDAMTARREADLLLVEFWIDAMDPGLVHLVAGNLGQVIGVLEVQAEKRRPALSAAA